jgi:four helix bundle protein
MANIAEGFERESGREFQRFLIIAKGSAGEVRSHLHVASELGYLPLEGFERLKQKSEEISKAIQGFVAYLPGR